MCPNERRLEGEKNHFDIKSGNAWYLSIFLCQRWLPHNYQSPNENRKVNSLWNCGSGSCTIYPRGSVLPHLFHTEIYRKRVRPRTKRAKKQTFYKPGINPPRIQKQALMHDTPVRGGKIKVSFRSLWESEFTTDAYLYISQSWCNYVGALKHILLREEHGDKWSPCRGSG